jgi:hypothetical protein
VVGGPAREVSDAVLIERVQDAEAVVTQMVARQADDLAELRHRRLAQPEAAGPVPREWSTTTTGGWCRRSRRPCG